MEWPLIIFEDNWSCISIHMISWHGFDVYVVHFDHFNLCYHLHSTMLWKHIETTWKWQTLFRCYFWSHFIERKLLCLDSDLTEVLKGTINNMATFINILAHIGLQAIISTNDSWLYWHIYWDHFVYAPNQCETMLHCNIVSHWLDACTKWSLHISITRLPWVKIPTDKLS